MDIFFSLLAGVLAFFYGIYSSYGFAIIALTLVVMIVLTPLTLKGTRSMMVMQQMQPEIKQLQSRYKDDRQKLNEELLKFYKENNINPLGGCLPLLVQMPIFIVLYQVLRGMTQRVPTIGNDVGWVTGQDGVGTALTNPPTIVTPFEPAYLPQDSQLYQDLAGSTTMRFLGMDLAESASQALSVSIPHALPYLLLIVGVGVTGYIQQKQIQGRNPNAEVNPQQQMMMKIMPIFLPVISFGLPSGLVLYFAVSNLYRIGQQSFISRSIYGMKKGTEAEALVGAAAGAKAGGKASASAGKSTAASKGGGERGSTKGSPAAKTAKSGGRPTGNGAGRTTPAKERTKAAGGAAGKSTTPAKESSSRAKRPSSGAGGGSQGTGADGGSTTLQPRARKKKKR